MRLWSKLGALYDSPSFHLRYLTKKVW